jgi:hypothetical protein
MDKYLGLIEMAVFFGIVFGVIAWQFWSLKRDNKLAAEEKARRAAEANDAAPPSTPSP